MITFVYYESTIPYSPVFFGVAFLRLLDKKTQLASTHVLWSRVFLLAPITHCRLAVLFRAPQGRDRLFPATGDHGKDFPYGIFPCEGLFPLEGLFPAVAMGFSRSRTNGAPEKTRDSASFDCSFLPLPSLRRRKQTSFFFHTQKTKKKKIFTLKSKKTSSKNEKQLSKWVFL